MLAPVNTPRQSRCRAFAARKHRWILAHYDSITPADRIASPLVLPIAVGQHELHVLQTVEAKRWLIPEAEDK